MNRLGIRIHPGTDRSYNRRGRRVTQISLLHHMSAMVSSGVRNDHQIFCNVECDNLLVPDITSIPLFHQFQQNVGYQGGTAVTIELQVFTIRHNRRYEDICISVTNDIGWFRD